jgi:hypothetical protein
MANRESDRQGKLGVSVLRQGLNEQRIRMRYPKQKGRKSHPVFV